MLGANNLYGIIVKHTQVTAVYSLQQDLFEKHHALHWDRRVKVTK